MNLVTRKDAMKKKRILTTTGKIWISILALVALNALVLTVILKP